MAGLRGAPLRPLKGCSLLSNQIGKPPRWILEIALLGAPRTKKNHGRVVWSWRLRRNVHLPSAAHERWFCLAKPQAARAAADARGLGCPLPFKGPVNVAAVFYRQAAAGDAVGFYQALADLLQAAGIVQDDKLIVTWNGTRLDKDSKQPRIEVLISES